MTDTICLPRSVVEQLVDPTEAGYIDWTAHSLGKCAYCSAAWQLVTGGIDHYDHTGSCPVRLAQEALKEQTHD